LESEVAAMSTILMAAGNVILFILKIIWKIILSLGALALCAAKIFLMLLILFGQIALVFVRLGESV
jgi:hypothetical protein